MWKKSATKDALKGVNVKTELLKNQIDWHDIECLFFLFFGFYVVSD